MTRRSKGKSAPRYRLHKPSNQAIVSIGGKMYYLGKYDSEESHQKYRQLLADKWNQPGAIAKPSEPEPDQEITISLLAVEFGKYAKRKYGDSNEWRQIQIVLKVTKPEYANLFADETVEIAKGRIRQYFGENNQLPF